MVHTTIEPKTLQHNLTLTDREKKIILIKYIIHGLSPFSEAPLNIRIKMLQVAAHQYGFDYDDNEFQELGRACLDIQQQVNDNAARLLQGNKEIHNIVMRNIKNGNDALIKVTDSILDGGLKKLGLKK